MDDRRPAQAGAQNPAYRPAHPLHTHLTCDGARFSGSGGTLGAHHRCRANALSSASRARPLASGTRWPYRSTVVVIDLCPSQRDTSEIGTPSASAVLAKVCRRSWKVASAGSWATASAGFQISRLRR